MVDRLSLVVALCALAVPASAQIVDDAPMILYAYKAHTSPDGNIVLCPAGDVDGDGLPDFAVADTFSNFGLVKNGAVRVRSGRDGSVIHEVFGTQNNAFLGYALANAGDVDDDGRPDLIAAGKELDPVTGAPTVARVFSGADGHVLFAIPADTAPGFGVSSLCGARDVDGDGASDVVVGSLAASPHGASSGAVRVFSGATHAQLHAFDGAAAGEALGISVAAADLDGDGHTDIIAGATGVMLPNGHIGCARVFSGADGTLMATLDAPPKFAGGSVQGSGYRVCTPGDLDHDDTEDVGVVIDGDGNNGYLRVFSGKTLAPIVDAGEGGPFFWIEAVDGAGDFNGDGVLDVLVGNQSGDVPSAVRVYSGVDGSILKAILLGWRGIELGDLDGDGFPDLGVSSRVVSGAPSHWSNWGFPNTLGGITLEIDAYATFGADTPAKVALRFGQASSPAWLVIGLQPIQQSFHGSYLFTSPDIVLPLPPADADGEIQLPGRWPAGVPSGTTILFQFLQIPASQPSKVLQSGALQANVP